MEKYPKPSVTQLDQNIRFLPNAPVETRESCAGKSSATGNALCLQPSEQGPPAGRLAMLRFSPRTSLNFQTEAGLLIDS